MMKLQETNVSTTIFSCDKKWLERKVSQDCPKNVSHTPDLHKSGIIKLPIFGGQIYGQFEEFSLQKCIV